MFYRRGAPNVKTLAPSGELTPDKKITVEGYVLDRNCNPISGAIVHAWYAGGNSAHYTFPPDFLWYRGFVRTNKVSNVAKVQFHWHNILLDRKKLKESTK